MSAVIQAEGLGKRYRLGESGYATLRERLDLRSRRRAAVDNGEREVWALRDVDLEIEEGDVVGIVGRNGAGKTTFLKTVARIVRPTTGVVRVRGRVGALLEVGTNLTLVAENGACRQAVRFQRLRPGTSLVPDADGEGGLHQVPDPGTAELP